MHDVEGDRRMSETITITLGKKNYQIPAFDIAQVMLLREHMFEEGIEAVGFLEVAVKHAKPPIYQLAKLPFDADELAAAVKVVVEFSGISRIKEPPPPKESARRRVKSKS